MYHTWAIAVTLLKYYVNESRQISMRHRDICRACGQNGGVKGMAKQLDIEELEVISHSGYQLISLK
jgi:hypothetical protein